MDFKERDEVYDDEEKPRPETVFYKDESRTILSKNDSEDIGFEYSVNPYRGCEHGCIYCYARPSHNYLGFSAGLDFETKIMVKEDAPELLEKAFQKKTWEPKTIVISGNTDCYQPVERKLKITRRLLEVCLKYRNPVSLITKNALIQRDIDILGRLAELELTRVNISITTLDEELRRMMEPRTASIARRFQTVEKLSQAGIFVGVGVAPVIPGLNDREIPALVQRAYESGAKAVFHTLLRLAYDNKQLFVNWLRENLPEKADRIIARIKDTRGGQLNQSQFGLRMSGSGKYADTIHELFEVSAAKFKLQYQGFHLRKDLFIRPNEQMRLF